MALIQLFWKSADAIRWRFLVLVFLSAASNTAVMMLISAVGKSGVTLVALRNLILFGLAIAIFVISQRRMLTEVSSRIEAMIHDIRIDLLERAKASEVLQIDEATITAADYAQSLRWLRDWRLDVSKLFADVDMLLTPTTPLVATRIAASADMISATRQLSRFTVGIGAAGFPAMSVPCGFDSDGLPVGMQLVAAHFAEPVLFRAGVEYQKRTDFHKRRPALE